MIRALACLALLASALAACDRAPPPPAEPAAERNAAAPARAEPLPDLVRIRLDTDAGPILLALDAKRAPVTAANFVRYAEQKRFDGTYFYRAARTKGATGRGFVQGGIRHSARRAFPPIEHEPTSKPGFAVFGRVEEGMETVRRILAAPTVANAGRGPMRGQMIEKPIRILAARRVE
jgi:peptidyl-prolyl cis-trans isomerase A (cyclophilin A)